MNNRAKILSDIIIETKLKQVNENDRQILLMWLRESKANIILYKKIIRGESIKERYLAEEELSKFIDVSAIKNRILKILLQRRRQRIIRIVSWSASSVACLLLTTLLLFHGSRNTQKIVVGQKKTTTIIQPKIKLTLEDGSTIDLQSIKATKINNAIINNGKISYSSASYREQKEIIHKIELAAGNQYILTLSDGTRVWLNSKTELEYPINFIKKERVVKLSGEAYFEVAHDSERPFIVETDKQKIQVLGTSFNINSYEDEPDVKTTLLTGKIVVTSEVSEMTLQPGMQSTMNRQTGKINIEKIDATASIAWKDGTFLFVNEDLRVVSRVLARWYNVEFIFDENIGRHTLNGNLNKKESLQSILESFTIIGGPKFTIKGNKVYIKEK